jgi:transcription factor SPN1
VRRSVYDILKNLPCQSEHLKSSGIGKTVLALRKHPAEIPENKRLLKELMEKWCRPIFGLSSDPRGTVAGNSDLSEIVRMRNQHQWSEMSISDAPIGNNTFDEVVAGKSQATKDAFDRVTAPRSIGYMFTVVPDTKRDSQNASKVVASVSGSRQKMAKRLKDMHSMNRKQAFGAVDVCLNGRNKA